MQPLDLGGDLGDAAHPQLLERRFQGRPQAVGLGVHVAHDGHVFLGLPLSPLERAHQLGLLIAQALRADAGGVQRLARLRERAVLIAQHAAQLASALYRACVLVGQGLLRLRGGTAFRRCGLVGRRERLDLLRRALLLIHQDLELRRAVLDSLGVHRTAVAARLERLALLAQLRARLGYGILQGLLLVARDLQVAVGLGLRCSVLLGGLARLRQLGGEAIDVGRRFIHRLGRGGDLSAQLGKRIDRARLLVHFAQVVGQFLELRRCLAALLRQRLQLGDDFLDAVRALGFCLKQQFGF